MSSEVSAAGADQELRRANERLERELAEAREQQAATAQILAAISSSPTNPYLVFAEIAASAARLCDADNAIIHRLIHGQLLLLARRGPIPTMVPVGQSALPFTREVVIGRAVIDKQTIHVADLQALAGEYPVGSEFARRLGHHTVLAVPLILAGEAIGAITIRRNEVRPFTERQIELLKTFADQAVIAIENTRLFEEVQEKNDALTEAHAQVSGALQRETATSQILRVIGSSPTDVQPVFDTIARSGVSVCGALGCVVLVVDGGMIRLAATQGVRPGRLERFRHEYPLPLTAEIDTAQTIRSRRMFHLADIENNPNATATDIENARLAGYRTRLMVPMVRGDRTLGLIAVTREDPTPFPDQLVELLRTFADQAVIAIENTRLFEEVQARTSDLTETLEKQMATSEILRVISRSPNDAQPVFDAVVAASKRLLGAHSALLSRIDSGYLEICAFTPVSPEADAELRRIYPVPLDAPGRISAVAREGIPMIITDTEAAPPAAAEIARRRGYRSMLIVPMLYQGSAVGTLNVTRANAGAFSEADVALLQTFADQAVIAIENTRLFEAEQASKRELQEALVQQTATTDVLQVISSSPGDLQPVFDGILTKATQVCGANFGNLFLCEGEVFRHVAMFGAPPEFAELRRRNPVVKSAPNSILDRLTTTKQLQHIRDFREELSYLDRVPASVELIEIAGARTVLGVPLVKANKVIGTIAIYRRHVEPFTDKQIELVKNFADQAVIAIENTRLLNELREALQQQTATADVLKVISRATFDLPKVLDTLVESAASLCDSYDTAILQKDGDVLRIVSHRGHIPSIGRQGTVPRTRGSAAWRAVLDRQTIHLADAQSETDEYPHSSAIAQRLGYHTLLAVPLIGAGEAVGVITLRRSEVRSFTDKQIDLLQTFADQAVIAIENTRLFEAEQASKRELQESLEYQTATSEVLGVISRSPNKVQPVLDTIVQTSQRLCQSDRAQFFMLENGKYCLAAYIGTNPEFLRYLSENPISATPGSGSTTGRAARERRTIHVPDTFADAESASSDLNRTGRGRSVLSVPLLRGDVAIGVITVARETVRPFTESQIELVETFADQALIAIENVRLFEEIAQKSRELEIASQHKSQFVANMSHELRTPLAAILGYAELMQEGFYGTPSEKSMDALTRIRSNGKHLLGLINTVLDIAKIESGQFSLNLSEYAIESVVETVRAATESLAETKKLALKTDVAKKLPVGTGDEQRLTQVLLNLVGNAIKFTDAGEVRVTATTMNGHFTVAVTDTGPGIPQEHQARVFEQFHQVDNSNTKAKGGTGLGLAIAKQIVEMHGGRIWVESTVGKGSTFQMELPIRAEARKAAE